MATSPTLSNLTTRSVAFTNQVAELLQFNDWEVENGSYNGVEFHILDSTASQLNPAEGIVNYFINSDASPPIGVDSGAVTVADTVARKLAVYKIPNANFDIIEDYGQSSPVISFVGLITGLNYSTLLQQLNKYFLDEPVNRQVASADQVGVLSGSDFRVLHHPFFGEIKNAFIHSWRITHTSQRFRSVAFEMTLISKNPTYLSNVPLGSAWQQEAQKIINRAEALIIGITQTFSLVTGLTTGSFPSTSVGAVDTSVTIPLIDTEGVYLSFTETQIQLQLQSLSDVFLNSVAFLVQNSGGEIANTFFDVVNIDFNLLPVFTTTTGRFSYSDAQSLLTSYSTQVNKFITQADENSYDFFLFENLKSLRNSVQVMDQISRELLLQGNETKFVTSNKALTLAEIIVKEGGSLENLDTIAQLNNGNYFSSLFIPAGTEIEIIV